MTSGSRNQRWRDGLILEQIPALFKSRTPAAAAPCITTEGVIRKRGGRCNGTAVEGIRRWLAVPKLLNLLLLTIVILLLLTAIIILMLLVLHRRMAPCTQPGILHAPTHCPNSPRPSAASYWPADCTR